MDDEMTPPIQEADDSWKTAKEPQERPKRADGVETIASRKMPEDK